MPGNTHLHLHRRVFGDRVPGRSSRLQDDASSLGYGHESLCILEEENCLHRDDIRLEFRKQVDHISSDHGEPRGRIHGLGSFDYAGGHVAESVTGSLIDDTETDDGSTWIYA